MTITLSIKPLVFKKDTNGNWYSIPGSELDAFVQAVEAVELTDWLSNEWYEAIDDLKARFGSYRMDDL